MASVTDIANRALQKLGAKRITSLSQDSVNARSANACYENLRDAELQAHEWSFSIERVQLAADAAAPAFGRANAFTLPSDYLRIARPDPNVVGTAGWWAGGVEFTGAVNGSGGSDWIIEGTKILTDESAPLDVRYVKRVTDPNVMVALFREALASRMALEMCEELTQSNSKKEGLRADYIAAIREARRVNAILKNPAFPPQDEWLTVRG